LGAPYKDISTSNADLLRLFFAAFDMKDGMSLEDGFNLVF